MLGQLRSHLAGVYRVERELGGGGMSRVFIAEELALGRRVVLKVCPPEVAALLSVDRFEREVRVAARLQHPNVVPLLAAGRAGDLLYYTMPFVEGESLRSRLASEGELPVPEAVRLFREIADALAYAHRQGVVHRDIKPENILLSQHHAAITDFGIVKALAVGGETPLTATGMSLGTPLYMAPEQAAADPHIDHRADLYSLGAVVYEMLTGKPPFGGPTAQSLIAAHLSQAPMPVTEARATVPPALATIVHRCLEKRSADRFQHAEEIVAALDALTAATPQVWPLPRALGYFALSGAAVLGLAWAIRTWAGLPDWFFPAAVILLALGLPVVALAALVHNRRLSGAARVPLIPRALHRWLTLRGAVWGGILAFSALGLATTVYMGMRVLGIGPVGTLLASGKLQERDRLVIADFANGTRDPLLGAAVTEAFRVDFSQSKLIAPVEAEYVRRVLRRMRRPDTILVDLGVAREIAQREGLKAVIAGELRQAGPSFLISAQLVSAESGEVLAIARETARDSTGILDAVDRVSSRLRERIGESLRSIRANARLAEVTTGSLEALRKYSQALHAEDVGDDVARAIALLEEAVVADSGFAMAWRKLGVMLYNEGGRPAQAEAAVTRAFRMRDRLTFRERKLTEQAYYSDVTEKQDSALAALESLLQEYPDDSWALNNLGVAYSFAGDQIAAEQAYRRAVTVDPDNFLSWSNLVATQIGLGRFDTAAAAIHLIKSRTPPGPGVDQLDVLLEMGRGHFAAAETRIREQIARHRRNAGAQVRLGHLLAGTLTVRGKLREADRALIASAELYAANGQPGPSLAQQARRAEAIALYVGDRRAALARWSEVLRASPVDRLAELDRPLGRLIRTAVLVGDRQRAEALLAEFETNPGLVPGRARNSARSVARGHVLAMRQEMLPQAIATFRRAEGGCRRCVHVAMAQAFDRLGMPDSALSYYEKWDAAGEGSWYGPGSFEIWPPVVLFRMGELYEGKGERAKAVDFYGRFAELWREADPELQPRVQVARRRLATLLAEPRD